MHVFLTHSRIKAKHNSNMECDNVNFTQIYYLLQWTWPGLQWRLVQRPLQYHLHPPLPSLYHHRSQHDLQIENFFFVIKPPWLQQNPRVSAKIQFSSDLQT